jgi:pyruvate formate lyase activating enzyme
VRQVLLPEYTDNENDLITLGIFLRKLKYLKKFELLPYHRLAITKYKDLKIKNQIANIHEPTKAMVQKAKQLIAGK